MMDKTPIVCPYCERTNDLHATESGSTPSEGDVSICWNCAKIARFVVTDGEITLREVDDEELGEILQEDDVAEALMLVTSATSPDEVLGRFFKEDN